MGRRSNLSKEVKVKACEEYLSGIKSVAQIARAFYFLLLYTI